MKQSKRTRKLIFRIWDKVNNSYIRLGNNKTTRSMWTEFPSRAMDAAPEVVNNSANFEVHAFDISKVPDMKFDIYHNVIKEVKPVEEKKEDAEKSIELYEELPVYSSIVDPIATQSELDVNVTSDSVNISYSQSDPSVSSTTDVNVNQ